MQSALKLIRDARQLPGFQHETAAGAEFVLLQALCSAATACRDYDLATDTCDQIENFGAGEGNSLARGSALNHRGQICQERHRYTEALSYYEDSLRAYQEADAPPALQSAIRHNIGIARSYVGRAKEGLSDLQYDLDECRRRGDIQGEAHTLNSIGLAKSRAGDVHGAELALREAIDKFVECHDIREEANAQNDLGIILRNFLDKPHEALERHQRDLAICYQLEDRRGSARAHIQIAACIAVIDTMSSARAFEHLRKVRMLVYIDTDPVVVSHACMVEGDIHADDGQFETARAAYADAIRLAEKGGDAAGQALTMVKLSGVLEKLGRHEEALSLLTHATEIAADGHLIDEKTAAFLLLTESDAEERFQE
ncbi:tetratricopeptide repeat protein [Amycolatopsis sp. WGS_07]|uniref:tetratricopeptide repeat protein n=1 Tax=Amycolatopsis sp. WGS_07 TaxID=3076764 RepID=UPI003873BC25